MDRVITYIDGFNLYFGLKSKKWQRYYWLNLSLLARNLLKPFQKHVCVKYFTSRIVTPVRKHHRQLVYLEALETLPDLSIFYGNYQHNPHTCPSCGYIETIPNEKMTDVNIAVELLADAYQDKFDTALLVSADSDLSAPIEKVRQLFPKKKVVSVFPPDRGSKELIRVSSAYFMIGRRVLANSQFDDEVISKSGYPLLRPDRWK
jgi:uncharacterized LabA/DUF88 family protein